MGQDPHAVELARAIENDPAAATNYKAFTTTNADGTPRVVMIANNIRQGEEFGVFLHEVGVHVGMRNAFSGNEVTNIANTVRDLTQDKDELTRQIAQKALARAEGGARLDEEVVAYFVEEAMRATDANGKPLYQPKALKQKQSTWRKVVDKVISLIKAFLERLGVKSKTPLTPQQIIDTAWGLAQKETQNFAAQENVAQPAAATPVNNEQVAKNLDSAEMLNLARHLFDETIETKAMTEEMYDDMLVERANGIANRIQAEQNRYIPEIQEAATNFLNDQKYGVFIEQIEALMPRQITAWQVESIYQKLGVDAETTWSVEEINDQLYADIPNNIRETAENEASEFLEWATKGVQKQWNKLGKNRDTYITDEVIRENPLPELNLDEREEAFLGTIFTIIALNNKRKIDYSDLIDSYRSVYGNKLPKLFDNIERFFKKKIKEIKKVEPYIPEDMKGTDVEERIRKDAEAEYRAKKNKYADSHFKPLNKLRKVYSKQIYQEANYYFDNLLSDTLFNADARETFNTLGKSNRASYEKMRKKAKTLLYLYSGGFDTKRNVSRVKDSSAYEMTPSVAEQLGQVTTKLKLNKMGEYFAQMIDDLNSDIPDAHKFAPLFVQTKKNEAGEEQQRPLDWIEWRKALVATMNGNKAIKEAIIKFLENEDFNADPLYEKPTDNPLNREKSYFEKLNVWHIRIEEEKNGGNRRLGLKEAAEFLWREYYNTKYETVSTREKLQKEFNELFDKEWVDNLFQTMEDFEDTIPWLNELLFAVNPLRQSDDIDNTNNRLQATAAELLGTQAALFKTSLQNYADMITATLNGEEYIDKDIDIQNDNQELEAETIEDLFEIANNKTNEILDADDENLLESREFDAEMQITKNESNSKGGFQVKNLRPAMAVIPTKYELKIFQDYDRAMKEFNENGGITENGKEPQLNTFLLNSFQESAINDPSNWFTKGDEELINYLFSKQAQNVEWQRVSPLLGSLIFVSSYTRNLDPAWAWKQGGLQKLILSHFVPPWAKNFLEEEHSVSEKAEVRRLLSNGFKESPTGVYQRNWRTKNLKDALKLAKIMSQDESKFMIVTNEQINLSGDSLSVPLTSIRTSVRNHQLQFLTGNKGNKYLEKYPEAVESIENLADNSVFFEIQGKEGYIREGINITKAMERYKWRDKRFRNEDPNVRDWENPNDTSFFSLFLATLGNYLYVNPSATGGISFTVTPHQQIKAGLVNEDDKSFEIIWNKGSRNLPSYNASDRNTYVLLWQEDNKGRAIPNLPPIGIMTRGRKILFDNPDLEGEDLKAITQVKASIFPTLSDLKELDYPGNKEELLKRLPITGIPKYVEIYPKTEDTHPLTWLEATVRMVLQNERYNAKSKFGYGGDNLMPQADFWTMGKAIYEHGQFTTEENQRIKKNQDTLKQHYVNGVFKYNVQKGKTEKRVYDKHGPKNIEIDNFSDANLYDIFYQHRHSTPNKDGRFSDDDTRNQQAHEFAQNRLEQLNNKLAEDKRKQTLNTKNGYSVPVEFELTTPDNKEFQDRARKFLIEQYFEKNDDLNRYLAENVKNAEKWANTELKNLSIEYKKILKSGSPNSLNEISELLNKTFYEIGERKPRAKKKKEKQEYKNNFVLDDDDLPDFGGIVQGGIKEQPLRNKYRQFGKDGLLIDPNNIMDALFAPLYDTLEFFKNQSVSETNEQAVQKIRNVLESLNSQSYKNHALGFYVAKDGTMRVTAKLPKALLQDLTELWYEISASEIVDPKTEVFNFIKNWNNGEEGFEKAKSRQRSQLLISKLKERGYEPPPMTDEELKQYNKTFMKSSGRPTELTENFVLSRWKNIFDELPNDVRADINDEIDIELIDWAKENKSIFGYALQEKHGLKTLLNYSEFKEEKEKITREIRNRILREKGHEEADLSFDENNEITKAINREVIDEVNKWETQQKANAFLPLFKHDIENLGRELMAALRMGQSNTGSRVLGKNIYGEDILKVSRQGSTSRAKELWGETPRLLHTPTGERIEDDSPWHRNFHILDSIFTEIPERKDDKEKDDKEKGDSDKYSSDRYGMEFGGSGKIYALGIPGNLKNLRVTSLGIAEKNPDFTDYTLNEVSPFIYGGEPELEDIFKGATPSADTAFKLRKRKDYPNKRNEIVDRDYVRLLKNAEMKIKEGLKEPEPLPDPTADDVVDFLTRRLAYIDRENAIKAKQGKNYQNDENLLKAFNIRLRFETNGLADNRQSYIQALIGTKKNGKWIKKGFLPILYGQKEGESSGQYAQRLIAKVDKLIKDREVWPTSINGTDYVDVKIDARKLAGLIGLSKEELTTEGGKILTDAFIKGMLLPGKQLKEEQAQQQYEKEAYGNALGNWNNMIVDEKKRAQKFRAEGFEQIKPASIKFDPRSNKPEALFHPAQYLPLGVELPIGGGETVTFTSPLQAFRAWQSGEFNPQVLFQRTSNNKRATFIVNTNKTSLDDDSALDMAAFILAESYKQDPNMITILKENDFFKDREFVYDLEGYSRYPRFWEENYPNVLRTALFRIEQDLKNEPDLLGKAQERKNNAVRDDKRWTVTKDLTKDKALNFLTELYLRTENMPETEEIPMRVKYGTRADGKPIGTYIDERNGTEKVDPNAPIYNELKTVFDSLTSAIDSEDRVSDLSNEERETNTPPEQWDDGWWYVYITPKQIADTLRDYFYTETIKVQFGNSKMPASSFTEDGLISFAKMIIEGGYLDDNIEGENDTNNFYRKIVGDKESKAVQDLRAHFNSDGGAGFLLTGKQLKEKEDARKFKAEIEGLIKHRGVLPLDKIAAYAKQINEATFIDKNEKTSLLNTLGKVDIDPFSDIPKNINIKTLPTNVREYIRERQKEAKAQTAEVEKENFEQEDLESLEEYEPQETNEEEYIPILNRDWKENDDVPFSKLFMESPLDTQERKKRAEEWMAKVLPTDIAREFVEMEKWGDKESYGKFTNKDGKKLISLALTGDVLSTAHHEAFHAFLSTIKENAPKHYDKLMQLSQKYKDVVVKVLTDKKAGNALNDIENNPEELATYAYQLWMANLIPNNALTKRVAGRLGRMWLRAAGFFNDELRRKGKEADSVLEAETKLMLLYKRFNDGAIGPNHSQDTFYRQLEADMSPTKLQERWNKVANFIGKYGDQLLNATDTVLRRTDIPELIEIADMFYVDVVDHDMSSMHAKGEKGGALSRYRQTRFRWENQYNEIIEELSEKEKNKIRQALLNIDSDAALKSLGESQKMMDAYKKMREFFKNIFTETLHKSGMKFKTQGNPSAHFFPFLWSRDAIKANRQEFINLLAEEYEQSGELLYRVDKDGKLFKKDAREYAEKITSEILGETLDKYKDRPFWITPGMFEQNVESAYLSFIKDRQKFDKFFVQSLDTVMHEYLVRGSKNATFREVFGNDGKKLHDLFEKATARIAEKHGLINPLGSGVFDTVTFHDIRSINNNDIAFAHVSEKYKGREQELRDSIAKLKEIMAPYYRAVDSMSGLLGTDMSPQLRKFNAIGVTYQNIRLLIGVLFSSFQDIAGLSMHGGGLKDQWQGLVRGLREGFGVALKKKSKDYMIKRAEEFGIVAPLSSIGMVQELTGTQHLTGFWGKANKTFFRINLMEGWNRGLRAQAMVIAERKLEDWAKSKALDPDIPTDSLLFKRCYGSKMKPGDIELDGDGHIANNEANRIALGRIVDDMIMNPTEANRPMWANDPRFMLFAQLKTFSYTLHRVMLRGVAEQLRLGNYAPATAALMGMVPMALTGYIAKEMILGMIDDDDDDWKFRLENVIPYAINRSGIGGIPQMYLEDILDVDPARLFGPTVDQIQNILSIPLRGWNPEYLPGRVSHMRNWNNELVAAMPAGTYLRRIPGLVDGSA